MSEYINMYELLNTTDGMKCLRNNSPLDDNTDTVTGVDWFKFNNVVATNLYVSGNMYIGFGTSAEQLKPYRRDGKMWYLYRQEGLICNTKFLKIRWEGYTQYSDTSASSRLIYEHFIFDDGRMFLNIVQAPASSSYLGTSQLVCGSNTYNLPLSTSPIQLLFTPTDNTGVEWTISQETPMFYVPKYLISVDDKFYQVDGTLIDSTILNAELFTNYGGDELPTKEVLLQLTNPSILEWTDMDNIDLKLSATISGSPSDPQALMFTLDTTDITIKGIDSITATYTGTVGVSVCNKGTWTDETDIDSFIANTTGLYEICKNNLQLNCKIILYDNATFTNMIFNFIN